MFETAFTTQSKLMAQYKEVNEANHALYQYKIIQEKCTIVLTGKIKGPYTESTTYWLSDGTMIDIITPSSLSWAYNQPIFNPY